MPTQKKKTSPRPVDTARAWWKSHVDAGQYVLDSSSAPNAAIAKLLRRERLVLEVAGRRVWILTLPNPLDDRAIFVANYWAVVSRVLDRYAPAAICGLEGVRLHLGDFSIPTVLTAQHNANKSLYDLPLAAEFDLRLRPGLRPNAVSDARIFPDESHGFASVPVLAAAPLLLTLREPEINRGIESITVWLRHLVLRQPELDAALADQPRPLIVRRLADLASASGNRPLARQLDHAVDRTTLTRTSPARTGVGHTIVVPAALSDQAPGTGTPWTDAQRVRLSRQTVEIGAVLEPLLADAPVFTARRLLAQALEAKGYDAYHSTTMEGYRISKELSDAIIAGAPLSDGPQDEESLRAAMAVQGYSRAFDTVLRLARTDVPIQRDMIADLYEELFRPSVDAGRVEAHTLRGWRTSGVSLVGSRHVPPNAKKLTDLLVGLEAYAATPTLSVTARALVIHLEFVTIHPFLDGNGRLGRLLMNLELLRAGLPWVTVRADERIPFFRSIERAQVDDDVTSFAALLGHLIRTAVTGLRARMPSRKRH